MVAHGQKKWRRQVICRCEQRNAVLFLPFGILNETGLELGRNQLLECCDDPIALVTNDKIRLFDSRMDQCIYRIANQRTAQDWDERLEEGFIETAQTRTLARHQDHCLRDSSHKRATL